MRTILILGAALLVASAFASAANASSESEWNKLDRTAHARCSMEIKKIAPTARVFRSIGRVPGIGGDGDLYYALLFRGQEGGKPARWLCLFDKHAQKAQARAMTD